MSSTTSRDSRLDVARGVSIAAIVVVHVFRGMHNAGLVAADQSILVDRLCGLWCLCVFAFLGGTFVPRGVAQRGVPNYLRDRILRFFVVYVMWTLMQGAIIVAAGSEVNMPTPVGALFSWWRPLSQLWYLPFLILVTLVFVPLQPWRRQRAPWMFGMATVISVAFWGYDGGYVGTQGLGLVAFFVAGMLCGTERVKAALDRLRPATAAVTAVVLLAITSLVAVATSATLPTVFWDDRSTASVTTGVVLAVASSAAVLLLGQALHHSRFLALLGRRSLDIYLAHIILASGTRIVLVSFGVTQEWIVVGCCVVAGVAGSLILSTVLRRLGVAWLFDGPGWIHRRGRSAVPAAQR